MARDVKRPNPDNARRQRYLLNEDGSRLLTEDGEPLILEPKTP